MKKVITILGVVGLVVLVVFLFALRRGLNLDKESKAYVDHVVPLIASSWSKDELVSNASPELMSSTSSEGLDRFFNALTTRLGYLKSYAGSEGQATVDYSPKGKRVSARYVARMKCDSGPATVTVTLIRKDGKWLIMNFHIESSALLR